VVAVFVYNLNLDKEIPLVRLNLPTIVKKLMFRLEKLTEIKE
jgi:hypothetical protein